PEGLRINMEKYCQSLPLLIKYGILYALHPVAPGTLLPVMQSCVYSEGWMFKIISTCVFQEGTSGTGD
ncbi:MAG: hypothetical protein LUQ71_05310, partial [Methanoregula sp.]|nr:hypothetical protein [Methanoregula sp.]